MAINRLNRRAALFPFLVIGLLELLIVAGAWFGKPDPVNAQSIAPRPGLIGSTSSTPSGACGGDLGSTYPNCTVVNLANVTNASLPNSGLVNASTTVSNVACTLGSACASSAFSSSASANLSTTTATTQILPIVGTNNPTASTNRNLFERVLPFSVKMVALYCSLNGGTGPGTSNSYTFTVEKNGAAPSNPLQCAIAGAAQTCNDTTHTETFTAGTDLTDISILTTVAGSAIGSATPASCAILY